MIKPFFVRKLGKIDASPFINFIKSNINFEVNNNRNRKRYFKNSTKCCFLIEDGIVENMDSLEHFMSLCDDLKIMFKKAYGPGSSKNIQFSLLNPKSEIKKHVDNGELFETSHRIHIPLITNEFVDFYIDNKKYNFSEGEVVEINNSKCHYVKNNSNCDRIHLIIDYIPKYFPKLMR